MELTITPELEGLIQRKLDSGKYQTPEQVLLNAVYHLDQDDEDFPGWTTTEIQAVADKGWEQADRGETMTGEEARLRLAERRAARQRA